jgi:hypothetical protein
MEERSAGPSDKHIRKSPGAAQVNVVFYDKADKGHEAINAFPVTTQPSAKVVASQVSFGDDVGLKAGHTSQVFVAGPDPLSWTV